MMQTNPKVMLIEDDPNDLLLTMRAMEKAGVASSDVLVARDGEEALRFFFGEDGTGGFAASLRETLRLILLDLKLPKISGIEVLKDNKNDDRTRVIPVTMLTSSDEDQDMVSCYKLGVNSYVQKPVSSEKFANVVKELGTYWVMVNKPISRHTPRPV